MFAHNYTKDQRSRMATKLASMKNGQVLLLNKNDPDNSIEVKFTRHKKACKLVAVDSGAIVATAPNETALVGQVVYALQHWQDVLKTHFALAMTK